MIDSVQSTDLSCDGSDDGDITVFASGGVQPLQYSIDSGATYQIGSSFDTLSGGTYQVIVMDSGGCISPVTPITIIEPAELSLVTSIVNVTCNGDFDGSALVTPTGGTGIYTYVWAPGAETDSSITGLAGGVYTVTVTDENSCDSVVSVTVNEPAPVIALISGNSSICSGDSTVLTASGGSTYLWSTTETGAIITVDPLSDFVYSVTATTGACSDTTSITVIVGSSTPVIISGLTSICVGDNVTLSASPANNYVWSPGGETTQSITVNPASTTIYSVVGSDSCGSSTDSITVTVNQLPTVFAGNDETVTLGSSVQLTGSGGPSYNWTPSTGLSCTNCPEPNATPLQTTSYTLEVIDANGCSNTDTVTIDVENVFVISIQEIFSPSSLEPKNNVAYVQGKGIKEVLTYIIYDRWGEKMFENNNFQANDRSAGWDGMFRGKLMNPAVFVYYVEAVYMNGENYQEKGDLTLLR